MPLNHRFHCLPRNFPAIEVWLLSFRSPSAGPFQGIVQIGWARFLTPENDPMTESTSSPSRRDFLKVSTAMAAGLAFLPNAHAKGNDTIKVGLIGCGGRGTGAADNICIEA